MSETRNRPLYKTEERIPPWRDGRVLGVLAQIVFLGLLAAGLLWLFDNVSSNLEALGPAQFVCRFGTDEQFSLRCAFDFLTSDAQFEISETIVPYKTSDSYWAAIRVGLLNTIKVSVVGIFLATILGTITGIARLSENWLVRNIAKWYIDLIRNTPLLLQLFFLYFVLLLAELPAVRDAIQLFELPIYISQRGVNFPRMVTMSSFAVWMAFVVLGLIQAQYLWMYLGRREEQTGRSSNRALWAALSFFVVAGIGWVIAGNTSQNESFMVARAERVREFSDLGPMMERRLGVDNLAFVPDALERGQLTEEDVAAQALRVCAVEGSASEVNFVAELQREKVPFTVQRFARPDQVIEALAAEESQCDVFVARTAVLAAERDTLENSSRYLIVAVSETPARLSLPRLEGLNFVGGSKMSLEFTALLVGLVLYTAAFIAEIVRAGIMSVGKGQSEAARALGLSEGQRLQLIVLPQALRVIIPPLTSQYLNLVKNSSLALAIAFPDLWQVMNTITSQSGRAIQPILLTAFTYLTISIIISLFLNWYNKRIQLVER
jgi:His/Glu/Gln/Arg/opine family amino acid ABC transporter permease subunit